MLDVEKIANGLATVCTALMFASLTIFAAKTIVWVWFTGFSVAVFFLKTRGRVELSLETYYLFFLGMLLFSAASIIWAWEPIWTLKLVRGMCITFICVAMLFISYSNNGGTWLLLRCLKWSGYLVALYQIKFYGIKRLWTLLMDAQRVTNEIGNANTIGLAIAYGCLFELLEIANNKKLTWTCPMLVPGILVVAATQSRKSMLIVIIGGLLVFCFYYIKPEEQLKTLLNIVVFLAVLVMVWKAFRTNHIFAGINNRMESLVNLFIGEGEVDGSAEARYEMIQIGWQQFKKTPILGIGMENGRVAARVYTQGRLDCYLHNNYIEVLCGGGITGFLIYYSRFLFILYELLKNINHKNKDYYPCLIITIILLIMDYGHITYYVPRNQAYIALLFLQIKSFDKGNNNQIYIKKRNICRYYR